MDTEDDGISTGTADTKPKPVAKDELAYLLVTAGIAGYVKTDNIVPLLLAVGVYAIGNFGMRIVSQIMEGRKAK